MGANEFDQYLKKLLDTSFAKAQNWLITKFQLGGWWGSVVQLIIGFLANCFTPREAGNQLKQVMNQQAQEFLRQVEQPRYMELPPGRETIPAVLRVQTGGGEVPVGQDLLLIPFTQDVKVKWSIWGHASVCHEQVAIADIVGGGFYREVWGAYKFPFQTITGVSEGETTIRLNAGVYLVRVVGSNKHSGGSITIEYKTVPDIEKAFAVDWGKVAIYSAIGLGIGGLLYGTIGLLRGSS